MEKGREGAGVYSMGMEQKVKLARRDDADWRGKHEKRFIWRRLRWEWGRMCYRTNCFGETLEAWWESD